MRDSETQEQALERLEQKRTHVASMRASEIQEQTLERLEQNRMRIMNMTASETRFKQPRCLSNSGGRVSAK